MQPLRNLVLIELQNAVKEEVRPSGIILLSTENNRYQFQDEESKLQDLIRQPKTNKGIVVSIGNKCDFAVKEDTIIYKKGGEISFLDIDDKKCALISESDILVKETSEGYLVNHNYVLVKISKEDREALFNRKIVTNTGEIVTLLIEQDKGSEDADSSTKFVGSGIITHVGANVSDAMVGDLGLIAYTCDNDESIIVGYEGEDKIIAVFAVSKKHEDENIIYESQRVKRTQIVWAKGDYEEMSSLYGTVRGDKLIAIKPYCFLSHEDTTVTKVAAGGFIYKEEEKIIKRNILSVPHETSLELGIEEGNVVTIDDYDIFSIKYENATISCINEEDIILK